MLSDQLIEEILNGIVVLDLTRYSDEPIRRPDQVLYTDPVTGRSIVARAPLHAEERVPA